MNRRGFLGAILVAASAPAIVRAQSLMPTRSGVLVPERTTIWKPKPYIARINGTHGLRAGDFIQIAGVAGTFLVAERPGGGHAAGVIELRPAIFPELPPDDQRFSDDPWA
jgi:hypothetical protein